MLMKALGYFQYGSDFGSDWQLATVAQGNKIDLFQDVDSGVREAMTRNDLAQLVLNTLEAGTVEAESDGSFSVGDVTFTSGVKYNYITSGRSYAKAINDKLDTNNDATQSSGSIVELGEKLYNGDLTKENSGTDNFGRPATIWSYKNDEIGTYPEKAEGTWTTKVSERDLYSAAGSTAVDKYSWTVYVDGKAVDFDPDDLSRSSDDRVLTTGNGVLTECFVDTDAEEVVVTLINTYVADVNKVVKNNDDYTVTVNYKTSPKGVTLNREFDTETEFAKDDVVILTVANGEIQSMALPEKMSGTVSSVKSNDYLKISSTTYNYNYAYTSKDRILGGLYDLENNDAANPEAGDDVTIYLDANGCVVAIEGADTSADDYLYVTGTDVAYGDVSAKVVFSDGTKATIDIDEVNGHDAKVSKDVKDYTQNGNAVIEDMVYKFAKSGSDYDLTTVFDKNIDGRDYKATNSSQAIKIEKNSASFSFYKVENDKVTDSKTGDPFTANSNTVYVDVENNRVFTGYRNVPGMTSKAGGFVVLNDGVVEIVFLTDAGSYDVDDDSFFFVKSTNDKEVVDTEDGDRYDWTVYVNGAKETISLTKGASSTISAPGLYKIESTNSKDWIDDVTELVTNFSADQSWATYAEKELLKLNNADKGDLTGEKDKKKSTFAFNGDTTFMVVELDKNGKPDDIRTGNYNDIETDRDGRTAVYVANVEDKTDDTPLATLVLVIVPYEGTTSGGQGPATDNTVIVNGTSITYKVGKGEDVPSVTEIRDDVLNKLKESWNPSRGDRISGSVESGLELTVNGTTYTITVDKSANTPREVTLGENVANSYILGGTTKAKAGDKITITLTQKVGSDLALDAVYKVTGSNVPADTRAVVTKAGVTSATKDVYNKIVFTTPEEFSAAVKKGNIYTYANGTYTPVSEKDDLKDVVYFEKSPETVDAVQGIITITFTMPSNDVKIEGLPKA
ncbi:hypothetical protein H6B31_08260 [Pseudoflavonifractor capillosus]|nr:hypothetical protein [Pseudoflavonifractor capillosus]